MSKAKFKSLIIVVSIVSTVAVIRAQTDLQKDSHCERLCLNSVVQCHFKKANYLLRNRVAINDDIAQCIADEFEKSKLEPPARLRLGVAEMEKTMAQPGGLPLTRTELGLMLADAKVSLAHRYLESNELESSEAFTKEAVNLYISLIPKDSDTAKSQDLVLRIAVGLIQCGRSAEALKVIHKIPTGNAAVAYLSAEAFFALASRGLAAAEYEKWINLGCKSEFMMLLTNEYHEQWTFLGRTEPPGLTICEQMPTELRSRLETLRRQFGHPNNIPERSFPGPFYRGLE
ncbi:MAG TPA: hypothetical protein VK468_08755 [Pyrinomonadaceae bacterium]|nr:hypothetical protein [Pyrinomonadaceae bacterium]